MKTRGVFWFGVAGVAAAVFGNDLPLASIHWKPAAHEFPSLGYREPVDLGASVLEVDRILKDKPPAAFNCHYYTKTFVEGCEPVFRECSPAGHETLTDLYLRRHGFRPVESGGAEPGDIVTAQRQPETLGESTVITHSGVVFATNEDGTIRAIRQKFNPTEPVVDVTLEEFVSIYAGKHPWRCVVWTRRGSVTGDL